MSNPQPKRRSTEELVGLYSKARYLSTNGGAREVS